MSKAELKQKFIEVLQLSDELGDAEIKRVFVEAMCEHLEAKTWDQSNKGKEWTDTELRVLLLDAPTKENCLKYALAFRRSVGSIELIYRWAMTPAKEIEETRSDNVFVQQIKRVSKELGWKA